MRSLAPLLLFLLTACNREERAEAPTAAENAQLDDAEAMLDNLEKAETENGAE
jgi:hypothetical protein